VIDSNKNRYARMIEWIFQKRFTKGDRIVPFSRVELEDAAASLNIKLPKNIGDVIYSMRYRTELPASVRRTAPKGMEWVIEGTGRAKYAFKLSPIHRITPNPNLAITKIPDSTPQIIASNALSDEQALLAVVRYNRLIDVFLGIASYSLQNHLRTTVPAVGQIEIDEIYLGIDLHGSQFVIPVQAKSGKDQLSVVQTRQDLACCASKFPDLVCRAVSAQFMENGVIALFELDIQEDKVVVCNERHYRLVPAEEISPEELRKYRLKK